MKSPIISPHTLDINSNTMMKPPHASSVPSLMDIDPFTQFEFHFPCQDMEWDFSDLSFSKPEEEYFGDSDLNVSFSSSLYQFLPDPDFTDEEEDDDDNEEDEKNEDDVDNEEGDVKSQVDDYYEEEEDSLVSTLLSTILQIAPKSVYKRRKNSMKRKRNRKKRKRMFVSAVDPEFYSLYDNVGDLFVQSSAESKVPPSNLPTINLGNINRTMLRRLPEVVDVPIISVSEKPEFYTKIVGNAVTRTTSIPFTQFDRPGGCCHGKLPAILTDIGPIPPPTESQYGYVYVDGGWKVKAECPRIPDPGGRRGGGYDGGGRVGGAERRESGRRKLCER